ncbi:MAG TPA: sigma-70 family RNA polymerase sigma factor [Candidatus Acidoferrales bacterium]|nr:sigma-70 family RNA polymerase sigma factor [Candidatus Acidoferrales bacterium]
MSELAQTLAWGRTEAELVTSLQSGSDAAFTWVVNYYHAAVYNVVFGILGERNDAADVTQEVFLKAFRGIGGFRQGSSLKTWLYRIAVREALNQRRWWRRHRRNEISIDAPADETHAPIEIEDVDATPFELLATRETQSAVRGALSKLPEAYRSAVILRDLEGLSYEEVAEVLEISVATVKTRILRGRRTLKQVLEPFLHPQQEARTENAVERPLPITERRAAASVLSCNRGSEPRSAASYAVISGRRERGGWQ